MNSKIGFGQRESFRNLPIINDLILIYEVIYDRRIALLWRSRKSNF